MSAPERIADSDRRLLTHLTAEVQAARRLEAFVSSHLAAVYGLGADDTILPSGEIRRGVSSEVTA